MDAAFLQAAAPRPHRVLGLDLQPLTIGHRFSLSRHGCAFIAGEQATIEDLMLSVFICSQPWQQAERSLKAWWFRMFVWLWSQTLRKKLLPVEYNKFHAYLNEGHACARVMSEGEPQESGSPFEWRLVVMLMHHFHVSFADALNMEIAKANALWVVLGEQKNSHQIAMNDRRSALWDFARKMDIEKGLN